MQSFQDQYGVPMFYLFYNPSVILHQVRSPLLERPPMSANSVGCRIIKKELLDDALKIHESNYSPSYGDLKYMLGGEHMNNTHEGGWRLEYFVGDLMLGCKEGLIDDSREFEALNQIMSMKTRAMAASLALTFDLTE